jgi:hypothetical protein
MYFPRPFLTILGVSARNGLVAALLASALLPHTAHAQTTMSTELTGAGSLDLSVEFMGSVARRASGGFEWYLTDLTFGVTPRLEVGAGWSALVPTSSGEPHEVVPHAKLTLFDGAATSVVAGGAWHAPVSNRHDARGYGWLYLVGSRTFDVRRPITLSAGVYEIVRRDATFGDTLRGVSLGWDHAITDRWSYSVEWISGSNWYGYLSPSVTFMTGPHWFTAGYCVGNDRTANHGPCFSAGRTF